MELREMEKRDISAFLELMQLLEKDMSWIFHAFFGNEKLRDKRIKKLLETPYHKFWLVEREERVIGFIMLYGNDDERSRHRAQIVIGVLPDAQNQGIGRDLMKKAIDWASMNDLKRLEAAVIAKHRSCMSLFHRMGFQIEGTRTNSLFLENSNADEFYLGLYLKGEKA